jgi:Protein of unknown function (DUF4245)
MSMQPEPVPKPEKNRLLQDGRDMFWSMAPLVLACIVLAGMVGMCSFQARGPQAGPIPEYDAAAALKADAETLGFPIRMPALPPGWQPNSGARAGLEDARTDPATGQRVRAKVSTVGYLSPSGKYLSLAQSNADEDRLVATIHNDVYPTGTEQVAGVGWIVYSGGERAEPVWTTHLAGADGGTQVALTGAGSTEEFRTLATATQTAAPLSDQPRR